MSIPQSNDALAHGEIAVKIAGEYALVKADYEPKDRPLIRPWVAVVEKILTPNTDSYAKADQSTIWYKSIATHSPMQYQLM